MWRFRIIVALFHILVLGEVFCAPKSTVNFSEEKIVSTKKIARHIKQLINPEIDPCVDYYAHICGSFNKSDPVFSRNIDLKQFIESDNLFPAPDKRTDAEVKMDNFLHSCKSKETENVKEFVKTFSFHKSVGGWPVFNKSWAESKLNLVEAMADLKRFGIEPLISLNFEQQYQGNFLKISVQEKRCCEENGELERILEWLDIDPSDRSDLINDCDQFEDEYFQDLDRSSNDFSLNITLSELGKMFPEFDWSKYINTVAARNVNDDFPVVVDNFENLTKVLKKLVHCDKKTLANYFFCAFIEKLYLSVVKEKSCYSETFIYFHSVVYRLIKDNFYNDEIHYHFLNVMRSILHGLLGSIDVFGGETSESVLKTIEKMLKDEFIPSLSDGNVNKYFEDLDIDRESYCRNVFNSYEHKMSKFFNEFFSDDKKDIIYQMFSTQAFMQSMYNSYNKPTSIVFTLLGMPFLAESIFFYRKFNEYSDPIRKCFQRQLKVSKDLDMSDIHGIEGTEIYVKSYNEWVKRNEEIILKENEILEEFGFTNKKMFFALAMQNACGYGNSEIPHKIILSTLGNLKDFSDEYNCPIGSSMNPEEKCSYT